MLALSSARSRDGRTEETYLPSLLPIYRHLGTCHLGGSSHARALLLVDGEGFAEWTYSSYIKYPRMWSLQDLLNWTKVWDFSQPQSLSKYSQPSTAVSQEATVTYIFAITNASLSSPPV